RANRHLARFRRGDAVRGGPAAQLLLDLATQRVAIAHPVGVYAETRVLEQGFQPQAAAEALPHGLVAAGHVDVAVARRERLVGRNRWVAIPALPWNHARGEMARRLKGVQRDLPAQHVGVDMLAGASTLAMEQRERYGIC